MEEIWKPVTGFEKFYEISNKGRIKSLRKKVMMCDRKAKQIIRTFESIIQAAKTMSICATSISAVCKKHRKTAGGYILIY